MKLQCSVCLEEFCPSSVIMVGRCGHLFHKDCMERWVASSERTLGRVGTCTCPICRTMLLRDKFIRVIHSEGMAVGGVEEDPAVLKESIYRLKDDIKYMSHDHSRMKLAMFRCQQHLAMLEREIAEKNLTIAALREQVSSRKAKENVAETLVELERCTEMLATLSRLLSSPPAAMNINPASAEGNSVGLTSFARNDMDEVIYDAVDSVHEARHLLQEAMVLMPDGESTMEQESQGLIPSNQRRSSMQQGGSENAFVKFFSRFSRS